MDCLLLEQLLVQSLVYSASSCVIWGACVQSNPICYPFYPYITHVRLCTRLFPLFLYGKQRKAAYDFTGHRTSTTASSIFCFICKNAKQESSKFYNDLRNASSLELTK